MTELLVSPTTPTAIRPLRAARPWEAVLSLASVHAARLVKHPATYLGYAWLGLGIGLAVPESPYEQYSALTGMVAFVLGPIAFFTANLVAGSGRRSGADEWMPSLPLSTTRRVAALLLACAAPALVAAGINLALLTLVDFDALVIDIAWQHLASVPLTVLGGAVLGVAVARLLPWPGTALAVMVGLVAFNVGIQDDLAYLGFYVDFAVWTDSDAIPAIRPGSGSWHLVYLGALTALAACGAFLRGARRAWAPVAAGAAFGVLALVAGWAQLP